MYPNIWPDGITIKEAAEIESEYFSFNFLSPKIRKNIEQKYVEPDTIDGYSPYLCRRYFLEKAVTDGKLRQLKTNKSGEPTYDPEQTLKVLYLPWHYTVNDKSQPPYPHINQEEVDTLVARYKEAISIGKWLKVTAWSARQFALLLAGYSPDEDVLKNNDPYGFLVPYMDQKSCKIIDQFTKLLESSTASGQIEPVDKTVSGVIYSAEGLISLARRLNFNVPNYLLDLIDNRIVSIGSTSGIPKIFDNAHPFHSEELAIAVECWQDLFAGGDWAGKKTPKWHVEEWLRDRYPEIKKTSKKFARLATIVNPDYRKKGGTPKIQKKTGATCN